MQPYSPIQSKPANLQKCKAKSSALSEPIEQQLFTLCNSSTQQQIYKQAMRNSALIAIFMLIVAAYANICGGNCPVGNCPSCPCGYTTKMIGLDTYCTLNSWNQNCCKCIAQRISGGSQNYFKYESSTFYGGIIAVSQGDAVNLCGVHPWSLVCYGYKINAQCAYRIFQRDGSWKYWEKDALACGCPITPQSESILDNLIEMKE